MITLNSILNEVKSQQEALNFLGFYIGYIDGYKNRKTIDAVKRFQSSRSITSDGIVGPVTAKHLSMAVRNAGKVIDVLSGPYSQFPWLGEAISLLGTTEIKGDKSNEDIIKWAADLEIKNYINDDIPWCGLFVAHCISLTTDKDPLPVNPLGSRNWAKFGVECPIPSIGSVLVFWRVNPNDWRGHVGFYYGEDDETYYVLGGNQNNQVNITRIRKERLLACRVPTVATKQSSFGLLTNRILTGKGVSENEQ